jgi:hypothetical protein
MKNSHAQTRGNGVRAARTAAPVVDKLACCDSGTPQGVCCAPKPHLLPDAPCCG